METWSEASQKKIAAIWCDFGDCRRAATVWVCCDGIKRPFCDLHKEDHSVHVGVDKYVMEMQGHYVKCDAEKTFKPVDDGPLIGTGYIIRARKDP